MKFYLSKAVTNSIVTHFILLLYEAQKRQNERNMQQEREREVERERGGV